MPNKNEKRHYSDRGLIRKWVVEKSLSLKPGKYAIPALFSVRAVQAHLKELGMLGGRNRKGRIGVSTINKKSYLHVRQENQRVEDRRDGERRNTDTTIADPAPETTVTETVE